MGRLGFNLVREKDVKQAANVESGLPADQQNQSNEHVEIGELLLTLDQRNRKIKQLRIQLATAMTIVVGLIIYILLIHWRHNNTVLHLRSEFSQILEQASEQDNRYQAAQEHYEALQGKILEQASCNCTDKEKAWSAEAEKLKLAMDVEKLQHEADNREATQKYFGLQESFENLQSEHEALTTKCLTKEEDLQAEIKKIQEERDDLLRKVEAGNRKLQQRQRAENQRQLTTPSPTTKRPRSLFDTDRLKKFNDLVKDIESGTPIFNVEDFIRKTDEVFRL